jgi:hypothetical protein
MAQKLENNISHNVSEWNIYPVSRIFKISIIQSRLSQIDPTPLKIFPFSVPPLHIQTTSKDLLISILLSDFEYIGWHLVPFTVHSQRRIISLFLEVQLQSGGV